MNQRKSTGAALDDRFTASPADIEQAVVELTPLIALLGRCFDDQPQPAGDPAHIDWLAALIADQNAQGLDALPDVAAAVGIDSETLSSLSARQREMLDLQAVATALSDDFAASEEIVEQLEAVEQRKFLDLLIDLLSGASPADPFIIQLRSDSALVTSTLDAQGSERNKVAHETRQHNAHVADLKAQQGDKTFMLNTMIALRKGEPISEEDTTRLAEMLRSLR